MMCTSLFDLTMENSTVEEEIADLDVEAPISVTVCFDEDFDEIPVKKEIVTNDYQTQDQKSQEIDNSAFVPILELGEKQIKTEIVTDDYQKQKQKSQAIDNSAFVPILEPKKEIEDETFVPDLTEELNQYIQNIISPHKTGILQDNVTNSNTSKKRKTLRLQNENQTKRGKNDNCDSENKNNSEINVNDGQNVSKNTSDIAAPVAYTSCNPNSVLQNAAPTTSLPDVNGLHQSELNKVNAHVTKCLALVSENLRCIMKAYDYHKQHKTPPESFKDIKFNYFNLSYKTVVDILLPEEKNTEFIQSFLNDTLQRAHKVAGPYYIRTFRDFANLLYEMFMWAKQQQLISEAARNSKNKNNNLVVNNLSIGSEADKVCIFSSGPPERELSINVDPVISKYFHTAPTTVQSSPDTSKNKPQKSKKNTEQFNSPADSLAKFAANYRNNKSKISQKPISTPQVPSPSTVAHNKQKPEHLPNTTADLTKNVLNNTSTHHPSLACLLQKPSVLPFSGVPQPLLQQESQRPPPPYGQFLQTRVESAQPINQYDPMRYLQTQFTPQQQLSMLYSQAHSKQPQQIQAQNGSVQQIQTHMAQTQQIQAQNGSVQQIQTHMAQTQQMAQYSVSMNYQTPLNQLQMPRYKQTKPPQVRPTQQYIQQQLQQQQLTQQQQQTERGPHMASLNMSSTIPPPLPSFNGPHVQPSNFVSWEHSQSKSGQWKQQNNQPQFTQPQQIQTYPAKQTEWHQELNAIYQVGQAPQLQGQKGSPRSASTDSGFISPLHFNITEQTVPTVPGESESIIPVITHVTSLNDKASFVESGSCAVCKKSTKQMCMGCMKIYYCTYECQSQDWTAHAQFCTQQTTNFDGALQS